ncbi:MAG: hypothetical protein ABSA52_25385 [Candidatus Binatia bacterium]|jgi:hypothetical protein
MQLGLAFWIIMLLWLVLGFWWSWPQAQNGFYGPMGNTLLLFILFGIVGWKILGPPIRG